MTTLPDAVIVRAADAESFGLANVSAQLIADSSHTHGAFSVMRTRLGDGADGARPHHHTGSSELFFVLDGSVDVLADNSVVTLGAGDTAVVPANMTHAFAATRGKDADLLVIISPGVERFDYFRLLAKVARGEATFEDVLRTQEQFDNVFTDSPTWTAHRA